MKNKMKHILVYFILASIFIVSCQEILFNEDERTKELNFDDFHAVLISGIFNIVLIQDSTNKLVITGKNGINSIEAVAHDDTLVIDDNKKMSFNTNKNNLEIHFSRLNYLVTYDPVSVVNKDTFKTDHFVYVAIGEIEEVSMTVNCITFHIVNSANTLGQFHLSGIADNCTFFNRYGSSIFADSLFCKDAEVVNESVGDVHVNASGNIRAFIWGPGNIYYYGTPAIDIVEKKGEGKLIRID